MNKKLALVLVALVFTLTFACCGLLASTRYAHGGIGQGGPMGPIFYIDSPVLPSGREIIFLRPYPIFSNTHFDLTISLDWENYHFFLYCSTYPACNIQAGQ